MNISERIKELREEKGLTQEKLARLLSVDRTVVNKWEHGVHAPSYDALLAMRKIFNCSLDYLFGLEE